MRAIFFAGVIATGFVCAAVSVVCAAEPSLVGHWPLSDDANDASGNGLHGTVEGVRFERTGDSAPAERVAVFDGRDDRIIVADHDLLDFGSQPFSIAVWIHTKRPLDDLLGDIVSKFDPAARRGLNFCIRTDTGTNYQPHHRQPFFGIDDGHLAAQWTDEGRPGKSLYMLSLCVYEKELYASTFEHNAPGRVYRYESADEWIDCGSPHNANAVPSLAVFEGRLYAGVGDYRARGSALPESTLREPGGRVYRYDGGTDWTDCGPVGDTVNVGALLEFKGDLYASGTYTAGLYRFVGDDEWISCGDAGRRVNSLARYNGSLYATTYDGSTELPGGHVNRFDGEKWHSCGLLPGVHQTYAFAIYEGKLYVSTWPEGRVFRYEGGETWTDCGRLGDEKEVMPMLVYNGKLYAGTLPSADVYRFDGRGRWTNLGHTDTTPDVKYRRAWSLATYDGRLFCGTLPSGHVYSLSVGESVLSGESLAAGWHHLAAVREPGSLKLYVDGRLAASTPPSDSQPLDISNGVPLAIGFGQHDFFNGKMSDLRIYRGALLDDSVKSLFQSRTSDGARR